MEQEADDRRRHDSVSFGDRDSVMSSSSLPPAGNESGTSAGSDFDVSADKVESEVMAHDSMVTVRLSEDSAVASNTSAVGAAVARRASTLSIVQNVDSSDDEQQETEPNDKQATPSSPASDGESRNLQDELAELAEDTDEAEDTDQGEETDQDEVNWEELQKTEDEEPKSQETDDVRTALAGCAWELC